MARDVLMDSNMSHLANTLAVVGAGSPLPEPELHGENTVIVVSDATRGADELKQALGRRLDIISRNGDFVERAVLALNDGGNSTGASLFERLPVVRLLLSCLSASK